MNDVILTGASRGIGRAFALELAGNSKYRLILVARDHVRLNGVVEEVKARGGEVLGLPGDLASVDEARALGDRLVGVANDRAILVHNAGLWPSRRTVTPEGLETSFVVNHLAPLAMQAPLLEQGLLSRVMVVSAVLIANGRFDAQRTPSGEDFSSLRTYCTTKLCFAVAMRDVAAQNPDLDVIVLHPGVVRTDLGARGGPVGWLLSLVKRGWESPERCARRLARVLAQERWSPRGNARWLVEETEQPWPAVAGEPHTRDAIRQTTKRLLEGAVVQGEQRPRRRAGAARH